jgi:DHA1 family tetracycline resistance protein-like MFS transporter
MTGRRVDAHALGTIFFTIFLDVLGFGLVIPFLGDEARVNFGSSALVGSLLSVSYSAAQFVSGPFWGRLSDRVGRRPVLLWSVTASAAGMLWLGLALAYSHWLGWLFAARVFSGIASGNIGVASAAIADVTEPRERARAMGLIGVAFGVGFVIGPGLGGGLADIAINGRHGAMACFMAAGLSAVNVLWVLLRLRESLAPELRAKKLSLSMNPFRLVEARRAFASPALARALTVNFLVLASFLTIDSTMRYFSADLFGMRLRDTGWMLAAMGLADAFAQGVLVRVLTRRGVRDVTLMRWGIFLQMAGFCALAASPSFGTSALVGAGMILTFGGGFVHPTMGAFISNHARADEQGAIFGVAQSIASAAQVAGPTIGGLLYGAIGPRSPYLLAAGGMLAALLLTMTMSMVPTVAASDPS